MENFIRCQNKSRRFSTVNVAHRKSDVHNIFSNSPPRLNAPPRPSCTPIRDDNEIPRTQSLIIGRVDQSPLLDNASVNLNVSNNQGDRADLISQKSAFMEMVDELHNINCLYQMSLTSVANFNGQLKMSKLFLNMVIHDLRNPTTSIKTGLEQTILKINQIKLYHEKHKKFCENANAVQHKLNENYEAFKNVSNNDCKSLLENVQVSDNHLIARVMVLQDIVGKIRESQNNSQQKFKTTISKIKSKQEQIFQEIGREPAVRNDEIQEYEDFIQEQMDENCSHALLDENFSCNRENLKKMEAKSSSIYQEKKVKMLGELKQIVEKTQLAISEENATKLLEKLVDQLLVSSDDCLYLDEKETQNQGTQTDEDSRILSMLDLLRQNHEDLEHLESFQPDHDELFNNLQKQMRLLEFQSKEQINFQQIVTNMVRVHQDYYRESSNIINKSALDAQKILSNQIYSQTMMENLINDLLDLAKLENNSFSLSKEYFNLGSTIYEAFQILISNANMNNIEFRAQIDEQNNLDFIQLIHGDQRRYLQIFLNFLSNSLKFTNKNGTITVCVKILNKQKCQIDSNSGIKSALEQSQNKILEKYAKRRQNFRINEPYNGNQRRKSIFDIPKEEPIEEDKDDEIKMIQFIEQKYRKTQRKKSNMQLQNLGIEQYQQGQEHYVNIQLSVIDTGVGMSEEGVKKLFIDFNKLDENSQRNKQGTGLGLSICKKIIEQMGGSVHIESKIGEGSKFIINVKTKCLISKHRLTKEKFGENQGIGNFVFLQKEKDQEEQQTFIQDIIKKQNSFDNQKIKVSSPALRREFKNIERDLHLINIERFKEMIGQDSIQQPSGSPVRQMQMSVEQEQLLIIQNDSSSSNEKNQSAEKKNEKFERKQQKHQIIKRNLSGGNKNVRSKGSEEILSKSSMVSLNDNKRTFKCLVANDDPCQLFMLETVLKMCNFDVKTAQNGFEAYQMAQAAYRYTEQNIDKIIDKWQSVKFRAETEMFDVIILDLNMPISDGYEACSKIKQLYKTNKLLKKSSQFKKSKGFKSNISTEQLISQQDHLMKEVKPLMIACSSDDVENPIIKEACRLAGFDQSITAPMTTGKVNEIVIKLILERDRDIFQKIFLLMKSGSSPNAILRHNSRNCFDQLEEFKCSSSQNSEEGSFSNIVNAERFAPPISIPEEEEEKVSSEVPQRKPICAYQKLQLQKQQKSKTMKNLYAQKPEEPLLSVLQEYSDEYNPSSAGKGYNAILASNSISQFYYEEQ